MGASARISDTARKGDLQISFDFDTADPERGREPFMCLRNPRSRVVVKFPLSKSYVFAPLGEINPSQKAAQQCFNRIDQYAQYLYGEASGTSVRAVAEAIASRLSDLIHMPPYTEDMTEDEFKERMDRHGVDLKANGVSVL